MIPVALVLIALALGACTASPSTDEREERTPKPEPTLGKYEQTWTTAYAETTCGDWINEMDDHQRFVMAGDMLVSLWRGEDSDAFPDDAVMDTFASGIGNACEGAGEELKLEVPEVAVLLYATATDIKPPR